MVTRGALLALCLAGLGCHGSPVMRSKAGAPGSGACFLLNELGAGEVRRGPVDICATRLTPASTFKIPHALAALDAGVLAPPDTMLTYDGTPYDVEPWRRNHTLASAMRYSVVWYFQRVAERLGMQREHEYVVRFGYGNQDVSSELTAFWLGGSLLISPEEQRDFLLRLYQGSLPVASSAMRAVREALIQPEGVIVGPSGERPFAAPWPTGTVLGAKTGSARTADGHVVRWLVGHVQRGTRQWVFVTCVADERDVPPDAVLELAGRELRMAQVL